MPGLKPAYIVVSLYALSLLLIGLGICKLIILGSQALSTFLGLVYPLIVSLNSQLDEQASKDK